MEATNEINAKNESVSKMRENLLHEHQAFLWRLAVLVAWREGLRSYEDMEDRLTFVAMARYLTSR
jgi:hypothetical protein